MRRLRLGLCLHGIFRDTLCLASVLTRGRLRLTSARLCDMLRGKKTPAQKRRVNPKETSVSQHTKRKAYPEPMMTYYRPGTRNRIHAAAASVGMSASAFTRVAVLARLKEVEREEGGAARTTVRAENGLTTR